ncbi:MAG TPA: YpdA family putative bacillithiol disulfide reductase [Thermoanaerobaculia bacterium]|nr:YpdA family putative bacillithiol disulfide reductase [Thermoanaerobaculia bacterium]
MSDERLDLLVVGSGPTGIAIGAEARQEGLSVLLVDRGPLTAAIQEYPTFLRFFTTRDRLEIAGIPFSAPEDKPSRRDALAYYASVVGRFQIPLALHQEVVEVVREEEGFRVETRPTLHGGPVTYRARAVALATGYWGHPYRLGVPGEDLPWVHVRYLEPYPHFGEDVVIVGAGNSAAEAALELWRNGARVTIVHRGEHVRPGIKYWVKPDLENRIEEGSIRAFFRTRVVAFSERGVEIETPEGPRTLPADAVYVLLGYCPDVDFERRAGIEVEPGTLIPRHDPETCESNVPGLYVAGTLQAGRRTDLIFIENSRDHGPKIVAHLKQRLAEIPEAARV